MSPELLPRLCLCVSVCLYLFATCSARPNWHQGNNDDDLPEERVNLHHTLKDLQHSASNAVKDMQKYIHQQLDSVAKTSLEKIGKPLATVVMGPALLIKESLDAITGKRKPPPEEEISSWCPSCLEDDGFDNPGSQPSYASPCSEPTCFDNNEQSSLPHSSGFDGEPQTSEYPLVSQQNSSEGDFVYPSEGESESKGSESDIDIRFGSSDD